MFFLSSCWAFLETDGEDICRFSQRAECGGFRIVKSEVTTQPSENKEEKKSE